MDEEPAVETTITKTITADDVDKFAEVTGDFAPIHVDEQFASMTPVGRRLAHGALIVGLMSTAATAWEEGQGIGALSVGYREVRFLRPVLLGDTISVTYTVRGPRPTKHYEAEVRAVNQHDQVVATATHLGRRWGPRARRVEGGLRTTAAVNNAGNTLDRVLASAAAEFYRCGFAASEMRTIAKNAGIRSATIYYHVPSKEDLLFNILKQVMEELVAIGESALVASQDPVKQLSELVKCHVRYHVENQVRATITDTELRSLTPEHYLSIVGLRDRYQQAFLLAVERGIEKGVYHFPNSRIAVYGIIAMCNEVSRWYRPDGPLTMDDISGLYVHLALQAVGWR